MKHFIVIFLLVSLSSCVNKNAKLVDGKSNIYNGGIIGQTVDGDSFSVSVWNIWNANDGIPLAEQHCKKYNKKVVSMSFSRVTGYYKCGIDPNQISKLAEQIINSSDVKLAVSNVANCIREKVIIYDDFKSDAKSIAEGVSEVCSSNFNKFAELFISKIDGSENWEYETKRKFKDDLKSSQSKRTLPFVLEWRSLIRRGWNKNQAPTDKEIPDKLFKVAI